MQTNSVVAIAFALALGATLTPALSHGDPTPRYGGIAQSAGDVSYELAPDREGLALYVEDHGSPVSMIGATGFLAVMTGGKRTDFPMKPAGENRMLVIGVHLSAGTRATAVLKMPSGQSIVVQFPRK